jgi:hypothetical protein
MKERGKKHIEKLQKNGEREKSKKERGGVNKGPFK